MIVDLFWTNLRSQHEKPLPSAICCLDSSRSDMIFSVVREVIPVTEENVLILQFLDCLKDIEKCAEEDMEICGKILSEYAEKHGITKTKIDRYINPFMRRG